MGCFSELRHQSAARYGLYLLIAIGAVALLWAVLRPGAAWLAGDLDKMTPNERAEVLNGARQTLIQSLGVFTLIIAAGHYFVTRRTQLTDRLNKAASLLSSADITGRIGGINALKDILRESPEQHYAVVSALTAFVRSRVPRGSPTAKPPDDVATAMSVLASRPVRAEPKYLLDLRNTELSGLELPGARLRWADLTDARLAHANLNEADLRDAVLDGADLSQAHLEQAKLAHSSIRKGALLKSARLIRATLTGAVIKADLTDALLNGCHLNKAWLLDSTLNTTDFSGVDLTGTWLSGDLRRCQNLTAKQVLTALPLRPKLPSALTALPEIRAHLYQIRYFVPPPRPLRP